MQNKQKKSGLIEATALKACVVIVMLGFTSVASALWQAQQTPVTSAYECTQVSLDNVDQALLTKEERIALLDESLTDSINSYSTCVSSVVQNMASSGSGQGGTGSVGAGEGQAGQNSAEAEQTTSQGKGTQTQAEGDEAAVLPNSTQIPDRSSGKGSTPAVRGIIAPKDNDKIICKLLYQEITKTQDPDMLNGLKEQYQNYQCG